MVPAGPGVLGEVDRDPLARLAGDRRANLVGDVVEVTLVDREAERCDEVRVALDHRLGLEHRPAQLLVGLPRLDQQRRPGVALEVAHLLRRGVGPDPDRAVAQHVPEGHHVRPSVAADRRAADDPLGGEERLELVVAHRDLGAAVQRIRLAAASTASRASRGSSTAASPASFRTSRTSHSTPAKLSATAIAPSSHSPTTLRCSRAQRARSGDIHTRASRAAVTSPVRGQPSTSAAGFTSARGLKRSLVSSARRIRSSRKWRTSALAGSYAARYQPSRPLIRAYGSTRRSEYSSSFSL